MSAVTSFAIADKFSTRGSKITSIKLGCVSREMEKVPTFVYTVHYEYGTVTWYLHSGELKEFKFNKIFNIISNFSW